MARGAARQDDALQVRIVRTALDHGLTSLDTAPLYEFGRSETLIGRAIVGRRDQVQLMTKVGLRWDDAHDGHGEVLFRFSDGGRMRSVRRDSRPASVRWEVEQSLSRLGVEALDLVQVHHPDPQTPIAETMGELARLRAEGKLREIGVSNYDPAQLRNAVEALGDIPLVSHQLHYSPVTRECERELLPYMRRTRVAALAYSPLEQGLLANDDTMRFAGDDRREQALFHPRNLRRVQHTLRSVVAPVAAAHRATIAQVVLAWLLAQGGVAAVVVGASSAEQVERSIGAAELVLDAEEVAHLRRGFEGLRLDRSAGRRVQAALGLARRGLRRARRLLDRQD
jgi:aryl-alcohol dehydrogenase-like predicted oxidoreductase